MKQILFYISLSILIVSCDTKREDKDFNKKHSITKDLKQKPTSALALEQAEIKAITERNGSIKKDFKVFKIFRLIDTIKADLNGDNIVDWAYTTNKNDRKEIFVLDGKTKTKIKIGLDKSFEEMSDDFSWVDFWGITEDKETYEILVNDGELIGDTITRLINKSIFVRKEEAGGGIITFKDHRFIWVHQSD